MNTSFSCTIPQVFDVQFDPGTGQAKAMLQQSFAPSLFGPTCGLALSWWEMRRAECGCGRVERVEYEQPKGRLVSLPPEVVSTTTVDNRWGDVVVVVALALDVVFT